MLSVQRRGAHALRRGCHTSQTGRNCSTRAGWRRPWPGTTLRHRSPAPSRSDWGCRLRPAEPIVARPATPRASPGGLSCARVCRAVAARPRSPVSPRAPRGPVLGGCTLAGRCPSVPPGSGVWCRAVRRHHSEASTPWAPLARDRGAAVRVYRPRLLLLHPPGTGPGAGVSGGAVPPAAAARQVRARRSTAGHHLGRGGRLL